MVQKRAVVRNLLTVKKIQNEQILILIRGFVVSGFNEEKAGK